MGLCDRRNSAACFEHRARLRMKSNVLIAKLQLIRLRRIEDERNEHRLLGTVLRFKDVLEPRTIRHRPMRKHFEITACLQPGLVLGEINPPKQFRRYFTSRKRSS